MGPPHGFADRRGVGRVVLAALAAHPVGRDELGGHQFDAMAVGAKQPCKVVRSGAGFHANDARRELGDQRRQLFPRYLGLDQDSFAVFIDTVHSKDVLGKIDSCTHNAHRLHIA